jgi:iron complex outermembrane receptor protein
VQGAYNDLAGKTEPQFSGLVNWKNDTTPWGWCRASRKNQVRRDGQEILGYTAADSAAKALASWPVLAPTFIGASLFEQKKTREGGAFDVEFKPSKELTLDLNGFYSQLKAPHQNTNWLAAPATQINRDGQVPTAYTVSNGTLTSASFATNSGEVDNIYRPDAGGETYYLDFNFKYRATKDLTFTGKLGKTHGVGWDRDDVYYQNNVDGGMNYALNGMSPADVPIRAAHHQAGQHGLGRRRRIAVGRQGTLRPDRRRPAPVERHLGFRQVRRPLHRPQTHRRASV